MRARAPLCLFFGVLLCGAGGIAQLPLAPPSPPPDARHKSDILAVFAHPDDDTLVIGYLARAIFDEHKRVAMVFITQGDHGGNEVGYEQAASLGLVREMEARRALASFGVLDVWFLDAPDTPAHDPLSSLEMWRHGATLEKVVRLIRLTRPEVIFTTLPDFVVGENHSDHQAAGVLTTEAFDLSGDPTVYAEQVTPPPDRKDFSQLVEGLRPWQPKKLYYLSDASHLEFTKGQGPTYLTTGLSPSRRVPYYRMAAEENSFYPSQSEGLPAKQALDKGDLHEYQQPVNFILGKSLVKAARTGDVFEGIVPGPIPFAPVQGYRPQADEGVVLELGSPWAFYRQFWKAHDIEHLDRLFAPEAGLMSGRAIQVPLLVRNGTDQAVEVTLTAKLPPGWKESSGTARYPVAARDTYPVQTEYVAPRVQVDQWQVLSWEAQVRGETVGSATLRVFVAHNGRSLWPAGVPGP